MFVGLTAFPLYPLRAIRVVRRMEKRILRRTSGDCFTVYKGYSFLARGVWSQFERSFYDIRVTHPNCLSNIGKPVADIYVEHQKAKKSEYQERVLQSEKASFTPLIFTTSGGMGPECTILYKRIAELTSSRKNEHYSSVMNYIRTRLRFAILRSTLIGIRGERGKSKSRHDVSLDEVSLNLIPSANAYECR